MVVFEKFLGIDLFMYFKVIFQFQFNIVLVINGVFDILQYIFLSLSFHLNRASPGHMNETVFDFILYRSPGSGQQRPEPFLKVELAIGLAYKIKHGQGFFPFTQP
ncbi:hypothetical protein SDC9_210490 [bioreactor metagenome]|uniref:Uncharacterized protein n=1 Tax=bioreactor metagenome TaxID=1076179 RepID=A0A645JHC3_9ZZZZ